MSLEVKGPPSFISQLSKGIRPPMPSAHRLRLFVCHFCCISCMAAICNFVRRFPHVQIQIDYDDVWKTRLLDV